MGNTSITRLTDRELLTRIEELTRRERKLTLAVIDHLIEVARRWLCAERGHRSLFAYCTDELDYSGSSAHRRISAARAIRRFPRIRRLLEERELTLSALVVAAKVLGPENADDVLKEVCGKSAREAEAVVVRYGVVVRPRERIGVVAVRGRALDEATHRETAASRNAGARYGSWGTAWRKDQSKGERQDESGVEREAPLATHSRGYTRRRLCTRRWKMRVCQ